MTILTAQNGTNMSENNEEKECGVRTFIFDRFARILD